MAKDAPVPKELVSEDLCVGEGVAATATDTVTVDYVGVGYKSQKVFELVPFNVVRRRPSPSAA